MAVLIYPCNYTEASYKRGVPCYRRGRGALGVILCLGKGLGFLYSMLRLGEKENFSHVKSYNGGRRAQLNASTEAKAVVIKRIRENYSSGWHDCTMSSLESHKFSRSVFALCTNLLLIWNHKNNKFYLHFINFSNFNLLTH